MVAERFLPSFFFVLFVAFVVKYLVAAIGCPRPFVVQILLRPQVAPSPPWFGRAAVIRTKNVSRGRTVFCEASPRPLTMELSPVPLARSVPQSGTVCIATEDRGNERAGHFRSGDPGSDCAPIDAPVQRKYT